MSESLGGNYQSISNMERETAEASRKKFSVIVAGKTQGAHQTIVAKLKSIGHTEVSGEESHYLVVFCPVASRVGTDISEALETIQGDTPIILVVMHHSFDPEHVVAESRRQVNNRNVRLTVDCLFHEGKFLNCNRNDIAWFDIQKVFGVPASQVSYCSQIYNWVKKNKMMAGAVCGLFIAGFVIIVIVLAIEETHK